MAFLLCMRTLFKTIVSEVCVSEILFSMFMNLVTRFWVFGPIEAP